MVCVDIGRAERLERWVFGVVALERRRAGSEPSPEAELGRCMPRRCSPSGWLFP
jgi:hypothetical protein